MTSTQRWTMVAAILGSSMVFLDVTIVNVALQKLGETLPATAIGTLEGQTYVVSGYLATLAALLVLAGALADYHGRRRIFAIGLAGFGTTSILCGLAPTLELLVVARILQGAAGALLIPGSLAILTALFDGPARARVFGIWAAATSATSVMGPILGGILVDTAGWRATFLVNVLPVAVALWATLRHMPESRDETASGRFDWLGALVGVIAIGGLAFGTIRGQERQWQDPLAWTSLGLGAVALVAFPLLMRVRPNPLVPLDLFRRRKFATVNLSTLLIYGALYTVLALTPLFLQGTLGYSATAAGIVALPFWILLALLSTRVGTLAGRLGSRRFLVAGPILMAVGLAWFARIPATSAAWQLAPGEPGTYLPPTSTLVDVGPYVLLFGLGVTLVVAPLTATLMSSVPVRNAGVASAINNAASRIGQPLLSALIFVVVSGTFYAAIAAAVPGIDPNDPAVREMVQPLNRPGPGATPEVAAATVEASVDALQFAMLACGAMLIAGAITNAVGLRERAVAQVPAQAPAAPEQAAAQRRTENGSP